MTGYKYGMTLRYKQLNFPGALIYIFSFGMWVHWSDVRSITLTPISIQTSTITVCVHVQLYVILFIIHVPLVYITVIVYIVLKDRHQWLGREFQGSLSLNVDKLFLKAIIYKLYHLF